MEKDFKLIIGYLKDFLKGRRLIFLCLIISLTIGVLSVLFTKPLYEANTSFITQSGNERSGGGAGLKSIAALIGISVGGSQSFKDIPVYLYPKLTGSVVYNKRLLDTKIVAPKHKGTITVREYILENEKPSVIKIIKKYTIGLPGRIIKYFKGESKSSLKPDIDDLEFLSKEDRDLIRHLGENVVLTIDAGDGSLHITATSDNSLIAAQIAQKAKEILQDLIIDYRIGKLKDSYDFIESEYTHKKKEYEEARTSLAYYTDRNRFNNTATSLIRKKELENKSSLTHSLYAELEKQRVNAQISLKEETPIFTTINPSVVPLEPSNSNGIGTIIKYGIFGFFMAVVIFVTRIYYRLIKSAWQEV